MVGGTNSDPSRETNPDLRHVAASCLMLRILIALSCHRRLRRHILLKGRDGLRVCHSVSSHLERQQNTVGEMQHSKQSCSQLGFIPGIGAKYRRHGDGLC